MEVSILHIQAGMGWLTVGNQVARVMAIDACHIGLEFVKHSFV